MNTIKKSQKLCGACGGKNTKTYLTTFPVTIREKQLNIGRVSVRECLDCGALKPTRAGQEKIERNVVVFMSLLNDNDFGSV